MLLTDEQKVEYQRTGLLAVAGLLPPSDVRLIREEVARLAATEHPSNLKEEASPSMRALHGCDQRSRLLARLVRDERLLLPAQQMLGEPAYLHQFKISMKPAFEGDVWRWHQDHAFWHFNDHLPESRAVSAAVFLNDVTQFNAPMWLIPGTLNAGLMPCRDPSRQAHLGEGRPRWHENVVANFRYVLDDDVVSSLANRHGIVAPTGPAGTVLFFHSSVPHASTWNLSPWDRIAVIISYNSVSNRPRNAPQRDQAQRPDFLAATDMNPLSAVRGLTE